MKITRFEDIEAWKVARSLTDRVYQATKTGTFSKDYGLKDQVCRAAVSIMANIAEGFDAGSGAEFARFLAYAQRSCSEIQSELYVALDQHYMSNAEFTEIYELAAKTKSKIGAFIKYLNEARRTKNEARSTKNHV
jgi:four helix bundle protein